MCGYHDPAVNCPQSILEGTILRILGYGDGKSFCGLVELKIPLIKKDQKFKKISKITEIQNQLFL